MESDQLHNKYHVMEYQMELALKEDLLIHLYQTWEEMLMQIT